MPVAASTVLSFEDARHVAEKQAALIRAQETEIVEILDASGRVLSEPILADRDFPPFPRSTRDGYAVRASEVVEIPVTLKLVGEIRAGESPDKILNEIGPGEAASIMTGAPVPFGADAVVMVEYTEQQGAQVRINRRIAPGENVVPTGAEARQGSILVERGERLNHAAMALAASAGKSRLQVYKRPRVAVLTTGDEIVSIEDSPGPTQIRNSNSYSLAMQIREAGGEPVLLPIAPDEPQELRSRIEQGLGSDLLIMTGGVSMGRYDLVEQVLEELMAEFFFTGAKIQPGRPVVFGKCGTAHGKQTYFFGLPGNPVSTMVTFELFARPMLDALAGKSPEKLRFAYAKLKSEIRVKTGLKRFLPAMLSGEFEASQVQLVPWQGSGDVAATARANCLIVIPADRELIPAGEFVPVLPR